MERVILHSDLNSFYASVECLYNPSLRGRPVSVCGDVDLRHGIVLASTPEARRCGVKTGDAVWQARQKCKDLIVVPPSMDRYHRISRIVRRIYGEYSPCVEPYGLDECFIDLTGAQRLFGEGVEAADRIRLRIQRELGLTASIGVSFTKSLAKLASDMRKPNYTTALPRETFREIAWPLPVSDLLFVGPKTTEKLRTIGVSTIGGLAKADPRTIKWLLGVNGLLVQDYANGIDDAPVCETGSKRRIDTIGNSITTVRDLVSREDIRVTAMLLAESVAERMRGYSFRCRTVQVTIRYANLAWFQRQAQLPFPSCTAKRIGDMACDLILQNWTGDPLRSLGVRGCRLCENETPQLSLYPEMVREQKQEELEIAMQDLRRRFGHFAVTRGTMVKEPLANVDIRSKDSAHTLAFYKGACV